MLSYGGEVKSPQYRTVTLIIHSHSWKRTLKILLQDEMHVLQHHCLPKMDCWFLHHMSVLGRHLPVYRHTQIISSKIKKIYTAQSLGLVVFLEQGGYIMTWTLNCNLGEKGWYQWGFKNISYLENVTVHVKVWRVRK